MKLSLEPHELARLVLFSNGFQPKTVTQTVYRDTDATLDRLCAVEADLAYHKAALEKVARLLNVPMVSGDYQPLHVRVVKELEALLAQLNKDAQ